MNSMKGKRNQGVWFKPTLRLIIIRHLTNFRRFVPGCIDGHGCIEASDSESGRIFQHFSRSTRLPHLCTAPVLIFALFCKFSLNFPDFCKILRICQQIEHFSLQISRNFAGIAGNDGELLEVCEFCRKMQKIFRGIWEFECMGKKEFEIKFREKGKGIYSRLN